jgi:hypothetical protein
VDPFKINGRYVQILIDGTPWTKSGREKDCDESLFRTHNKGKDNEWREYYHYVVEAKLALAT